MDLEEAKTKFIELTSEIKATKLAQFISWIQECDRFKFKENSDVVLENISSDIRELVPFEAVLPSEKTFVPSEGKNSDCGENVLHVDSFLYDDEYLDDLVDNGKFSRNYCCNCGSKDTKPYTFISHSSSPSSLKLLFQEVLPDLSERTFVDVGSRLGAVLYAANLYSSCNRIVGIELNRELCELQERIISKYSMNDRVRIVCSNVLECSDLLKSADVLMMNNVFEFFTESSEVAELWRFVVRTYRGRGKLLVTCPSLSESLEVVGLSCVIPAWVEELGIEPGILERNEDLQDVHVYELK